jgi:hypothetical protein
VKERLTVKEASVVVNRAPSRIYQWIGDGKLGSDTDVDGVTTVSRAELLRVEPTVRRGRPRGTPTRRA